MNLRKISALVCLLAASLMFASCTVSQIQLAENIVALSLPLSALIPGQTGADGQAIASYTGPALEIADTLVANWSPAGAAQAAGQFNMLVLPKLSANATPQTQQALAKFAASIQAFIAGASAATNTTLQLPPGVHAFVAEQVVKSKGPDPKADQKRIEKLKQRIKAAKEKLKQAQKK